MSLPSLEGACASQEALLSILSTLLEPSRSLKQHLVPALHDALQRSRLESYSDLINAAEKQVATWSQDEKADFLGGHPRIGEVAHLSALSSKEQNNAQVTPPEVLARLKVACIHISSLGFPTDARSQSLNALYESRYPKLKYVTFVAGRSRAQVADDMEAFLLHDNGEKDSEGISDSITRTCQPGSVEWTGELERGIIDVFRIAKARLKGLDLQ